MICLVCFSTHTMKCWKWFCSGLFNGQRANSALPTWPIIVCGVVVQTCHTSVSCPTCTWPPTSKAITGMKAQQSPGMAATHYHELCYWQRNRLLILVSVPCTLWLSHRVRSLADKLFTTSWIHAVRRDKAVLQKFAQASPSRLPRNTHMAWTWHFLDYGWVSKVQVVVLRKYVYRQQRVEIEVTTH